MFRHMDSFSLFDDIHPLQTQPTIWKMAHGDVVTPNSKSWASSAAKFGDQGRDQSASTLRLNPWELASSPATTDASTERYCSRSVSPSACSSSGSSRHSSDGNQSFDGLHFGQRRSSGSISASSSASNVVQCPPSAASLPMRMPQPAQDTTSRSGSSTSALPFCRPTLSYDFLEATSTGEVVSPLSSGSNASAACSSPSGSFPDLSAMFTPVATSQVAERQQQPEHLVAASPAFLEALLKLRADPSCPARAVNNVDVFEAMRCAVQTAAAPCTVLPAPNPTSDLDVLLQSLLALPSPAPAPTVPSASAGLSGIASGGGYPGRFAVCAESNAGIEAALGFLPEDRGDLLSALAMSKCTHQGLLAAYLHNSRVVAEDAAAEAAQRSFPGRHCGPAQEPLAVPSFTAAPLVDAMSVTASSAGLQLLISQLLSQGSLLGASASSSLPQARSQARQQQSARGGGGPPLPRRAAAAPPPPVRNGGGRGRPTQQRGGAVEWQQALLAQQAAALAALQQQQAALPHLQVPALGARCWPAAPSGGASVPPPHMPFGQMLQKMSATRRA